jgi:Flp pilus assembly protein TadD
MIEASVFGLDPGAMHRSNLLLHWINSLLLWRILAWSTGRVLVATLPALLFAVHPVHVESVAWVTERKDVLSTFFAFGSILWYLASLRRKEKRRLPQTLSLVWFALALLSKPMPMTLPLLLLGLDWWPLGRLRRGGNWRPALAEKIPFLLLSLAAALIAWRGLSDLAMAGLGDLGLSRRVVLALAGLGGYLRTLVFPTGLSAMYLPSGGAGAVAGGLLLITLSAAAIVARRRCPSLTVGWFWFLAAVAPVSGLLQSGFQSRADRFAYLPFVGLYTGLAFGLPALMTGRRLRALAGAACVGVIALGTAAREQVLVWRNSETLFGHILALDPGNWVAQHNLGVHLLRQERYAEAIPHLQAAVSAKPRLPMARANLARSLEKAGRLEEAAEQYQWVLELIPVQDETREHLANMLLGLGDVSGAAAHFQALVQSHPASAQAWFNLGMVRERQGRREDAIAAYGFAASLAPSWGLPRQRRAGLGGRR